MNIGFVGLGKMGGPMARNLINAGHSLTVNDVNEAATARHRELGATWAATPREVAAASDVIFTSLPGPDEIEQVASGKDGLIEGVRRGAVYVDLSTNSPGVIKRIARRFEAYGAHVVDAPVSGGPMGAEAGTLSVMVGGPPDVVERIRPILDVLGVVSYAGEVGSGTVAKLVHNAITMTTRIVVQDGMALAVKAGVDPQVMLDILKNASFGKQLMLTTHIPDLVFKGDFDHPRFSLGLANKDVTLALELADETDAPMPLVVMAHEVIGEAMARGWADRDSVVTFLLAEERTGVKIRTKGNGG